ncbi:ankyrin-2 [Iris pallida]|uniref:Ankyrin-2 n=1 Tax=Iris pallida TaxID=29817 RepID=A0AAX6DMQ1_IRIPA|nr:ankyrin-2 [Iris pallida]
MELLRLGRHHSEQPGHERVPLPPPVLLERAAPADLRLLAHHVPPPRLPPPQHPRRPHHRQRLRVRRPLPPLRVLPHPPPARHRDPRQLVQHDPLRLRHAVLPRERQRRLPSPVRPHVALRAARDQQLADLRVALPRRQHQRRVSVLVGQIDVVAPVAQEMDAQQVPAARGAVQSVEPRHVPLLEGELQHHLLEELAAPAQPAEPHRRLPGLVGQARVGAAEDQDPERVDVPFPGRDHNRGEPALVLPVDVDVRPHQERFQRSGVAAPGGEHHVRKQRRIAPCSMRGRSGADGVEDGAPEAGPPPAGGGDRLRGSAVVVDEGQIGARVDEHPDAVLPLVPSAQHQRGVAGARPRVRVAAPVAQAPEDRVLAEAGGHVDRPELVLPAGGHRELVVGSGRQEGLRGAGVGAEDGVVEQRAAAVESVGGVVVEEHAEYGAGGLEVLHCAPGHAVGLGEPRPDSELLAVGGVPRPRTQAHLRVLSHSSLD